MKTHRFMYETGLELALDWMYFRKRLRQLFRLTGICFECRYRFPRWQLKWGADGVEEYCGRCRGKFKAEFLKRMDAGEVEFGELQEAVRFFLNDSRRG
jgi:hypothetical protein